MTTTDTVTTATGEETQYIKAQDWPQCSICGVMFCYADHGPYAHNTCSQRCACTAAIVGALGQLTTAFSDWRTELRQAVIDPPW